MDSVREEVRVILTEVAQGAAKIKAHPDQFYAAIQGGEDAIMSALKRGAGVEGVNDWGSYDGETPAEFLRRIANKELADPSCSDMHTLANHLERITSAVEPSEELGKILNPDRETAPKTAPEELGAVEPSCVVTDEMVEAAWETFVGASEDWRDGAVRRRNAQDKAALKAALTAALSSRTEEEVRADERERLARRIREQGRAINDDWGWCSAIADAIDCDFSVLNKPPARSLTNGGD